ncbi:MAG: ABC transporter permease, partial [Acidobacteria bacterium]|nr:ABC transporter permease [Acidobacteriota bacterium]
MTDLSADLRLALRQWLRRPLLPAAVVLTLTAGLGAAIAVFAVAWAVVWRPLDVPAPERLVWIASVSAGQADGSSPGAALTWQADARTLDALAAVRHVAGAYADGGGTDRLPGALVTASLFDVLTLAPAQGRAFTAADDAPGAARVVLLAHRVWHTRYAGAADTIGRVVTLDGRPATIIGVLPTHAETLVPDADWWAPLALAPAERANIGPRYLDLVGRLAATASPAAAMQELAAIGARLSLKADDGSPLGVRVTPLADHLTARYRPGLVLLLAGVAALVLIACANVATLLLTRAQDRQAELALRASLGATPARLARQLLVEAALLASVASTGGLLAALWLVDVLRVVLPADVPRLADARVDGVVAAFALGAGVVVTLLAGLSPALRGARVDLQSVLRIAASGGAGHERLRRTFVVAQVAVAVVLACAGVLLTRSASALAAAPRGYEAAGVVTASLTLPAATYGDAPSIAAAIDRIVAGATAVPGVRAAAAASQLPFAGGSAGSDVILAGEPMSPGVDRQARVRLVSPAYLSTLGVTMVEGREIGREDGATSRPVVVVNQTLARRLSPGRSPVGHDVTFGVPVFGGPDGTRVWHVVGVAADT